MPNLNTLAPCAVTTPPFVAPPRRMPSRRRAWKPTSNGLEISITGGPAGIPPGRLCILPQVGSLEVSAPEMTEDYLRVFHSGGVSQLFKTNTTITINICQI